MLLWRRIGPIKATTASILFSFFLVGITSHFFKLEWGLQYLACFAAGALAAGIAYTNVTELAKWKDFRWGVLAAIAFVIWLPIAWKHPSSTTFNDMLFTVFSFSLLLQASKPLPNTLSSFLGARPLAWLGTISYSLYLIHAPLLQLFQQTLLMPHHITTLKAFVALVAVGVPSIIGVSYLFHMTCERPFMNTKPNKEIILTRN